MHTAYKLQIVLNKVKGILNKLTPQKFDVLVETFQELQIDNESKLIGSIDLIFEKVMCVLLKFLITVW